jgi:Chlorophyll A-B binding protein
MPSQTPQTPETRKTPATAESSSTPEPSLGWTVYAERLNGRFAMIGLVLLLVLEFFTREDFITWLGFR